MEKLIFDFLDKYVGMGVNMSEVTMIDPYTFIPEIVYFVSSDNGTKVIQINTKRDRSRRCAKVEDKLNNTISIFFSIDSIDSYIYISKWFKKKYNIKNLNEIKKIIDDKKGFTYSSIQDTINLM